MIVCCMVTAFFFIGALLQLIGVTLSMYKRHRFGCIFFTGGAVPVMYAAWQNQDSTLILGQTLITIILFLIMPAHKSTSTLWQACRDTYTAFRQFWLQYSGLCKQTLILLLALVAVLALPLFAPSTESLHHFIKQYTGISNNTHQSHASFILLAGLLSFIGIPRQALSFVAGLFFGVYMGTFLATLATTLGCAMAFATSRFLSTLWRNRQKKTEQKTILFHNFILKYEKHYRTLHNLLLQNPFCMAVLLRLFPSGNNLLFSLLGGIMRMPALAFIGGSCLGYIPQNLIFALMGSGTYNDGPWRIVIAIALFVCTALLGIWIWRRADRQSACAHEQA